MLTLSDWERAGGAYCSACGQEVLRMVDGVCMGCCNVLTRKSEAIVEEKAERRYIMRRFREGTITQEDLDS